MLKCWKLELINAGFEATDVYEYHPLVLRGFYSELQFGRQLSPLVELVLHHFRHASMQQARELHAAGACPGARLPCRVPPLLAALDMKCRLKLVHCLVAAGASVNIHHPRVTATYR